MGTPIFFLLAIINCQQMKTRLFQSACVTCMQLPFRQIVPALLLAALLSGVSIPLIALEVDQNKAQAVVMQRFGTQGVENLNRWLRLLKMAQTQPEEQQLKTVNQFWNQVATAGEDIDIWGTEDYWATPLETLGQGRADCEDYVIGKYFSLLKLGVEASKLRLIYVRAQVAGQDRAHMVLGYYAYPGAEPLVLDNLTSLIRPASKRIDLTPIFGFNAQGVYVQGAAPRSVEQLSRWRQLLQRMQGEGFSP